MINYHREGLIRGIATLVAAALVIPPNGCSALNPPSSVDTSGPKVTSTPLPDCIYAPGEVFFAPDGRALIISRDLDGTYEYIDTTGRSSFLVTFVNNQGKVETGIIDKDNLNSSTCIIK